MKKLIILVLCLALFLPIALAIKECQRTQQVSDIPCNVISSWKPSSCIQNVSVYNSTGANIQNFTWANYPPVCNFTFNITKTGTYHYNSTIENGVITVEDSMLSLSLIIGVGIVAALIFLFAFKLDESHGILKILLSISGFTVMLLIPLSIIVPDTLGTTFYQVFLYIFVAFWLYVILYFVWWLFQKFSRTIQ